MMERPFFSLAKRPRIDPIEYEVGETWVQVIPNQHLGMATIWDADILIWAATQITEAMDRGLRPNRTVRFHPYDLMKAIRRSTGGNDYVRMRAAMDRLAGTLVKTNIRAGGRRKSSSFHWLEAWSETTDEETGETLSMNMTLPDWLYQGIVTKGGILTIHEDYFLLTGGIERWLYRVARKHAGMQEQGWQFTMRQLYAKSGSKARFSNFAIDIRKVVKADNLPEYCLELHKNREGAEVIHFLRRSMLDIMDPRFEGPRHSRRRIAGGITQPGLRFSGETRN